MTHRTPRDVDPAARAVIGRLARRLAPAPRWAAPGDRDDLTQELALHAHRIRDRYDPTRGSPLDYFESALTNHLRDLRAKAEAACRDWRRRVSFEHPDDVPFRSRRSIQLQLDVRDALAAAPEPLRRMAEELGRDTLLGAARTLGLTRQQARHRRQLLAEYFAARGLDPRDTPAERRAA